MKKLISTGGIGDAFIAGLKINELHDVHCCDWLHVESSDISKPVSSIQRTYFPKFFRASFEHDPDYIKNFSGEKWKDRKSVPISFTRKCSLHNSFMGIHDPFLKGAAKAKIEYDISIQVSAGNGNNRQWFFDIVQLGRALVRNFGYKVCFIGNDSTFDHPREIEFGLSNDVCRWENLADAAWTINKSKLHIGLSGFLTYYACACKIPNIHLIEGPNQEEDYFHDDWKPLTYGISSPSFASVMRGINHYRGAGVL